MTKLKKSVITIIVCLLVVLGLYFVQKNLVRRGGEVLDTFETERFGLTVRVTSRMENAFVVPGAIYLFEAIKADGKKTEIFTFRHDEPVPIDENGVVFTNDKVAYVFMAWKFAVTVDGGETWSVWNAEKNLDDWKCCPYSLINNVFVKEDGQGEMRLSGPNNEVTQVLFTKDFGRTWNALR